MSGPGDDDQPEFDSSEEFEGIDVDIEADGTVHLHAACKPGEDPEHCRKRVQGLVQALGLPLDAVVTDVGGQPADPPAPPAGAEPEAPD